jgi:hypothetical protein
MRNNYPLSCGFFISNYLITPLALYHQFAILTKSRRNGRIEAEIRKMKTVIINSSTNGKIGEFPLTRDGMIEAATFAFNIDSNKTNPSEFISAVIDGEKCRDMREFMSLSNNDEYTDEDMADCLRRAGKSLEV